MKTRRIAAAVLLAVLLGGLGALGAEPRIGSWGDQGDGTYRNPVLNANYPDSDVEQVGDTYYMIASSNHYAPGMSILQSRDLVNWQLIGHVWEQLSWRPHYHWDRMDGYRFGVWAGDLAFHDGRWYCYQIDPKAGLMVSTAKEIRGPWSEPILMLGHEKVGTDPAVYWDDDNHEAWLICNAGGQRLFRMSWDGTRLLDEGRIVFRAQATEAAKIYRIDGRWYIFCIEWHGKPGSHEGDRKQLVLRSTNDSLYGPYEQKTVLEKGTAFDRSACQGALVQAPDGSWWYLHQLVQNSPNNWQGRPQCLEPVRWVDGWPQIGEDEDGDGIGEPVLACRKPVPDSPMDAPQTTDEFDRPQLGPQWQWNHNPRADRWSLTERPGWLRLKAGKPIGKGGFWNAANTLSQRLMGNRAGTVTARLDLSGARPGMQAGFCHHSGQYVLLGVRVDGEGRCRVIFNHDGAEGCGPEVDPGLLYVRTMIDGPEATVSWSRDGRAWKRLGRFPLKFGRWQGDRLGFYCWNDFTDDPAQSGHLDVAWFRYEYDGPMP